MNDDSHNDISKLCQLTKAHLERCADCNKQTFTESERMLLFMTETVKRTEIFLFVLMWGILLYVFIYRSF